MDNNSTIVLPLQTRITDDTTTIVNLPSLSEQIHASQEFLNDFYMRVKEKFGNTMIDVGVFKGVLNEKGLADILNTMLSTHSTNPNVNSKEKFIVVALAGFDVPSLPAIEEENDISLAECFHPHQQTYQANKHIQLMNNVADTLLFLYNKRMELINQNKQEKIVRLEKLIAKGWKIKTLEQSADEDENNIDGVPKKKLKYAERIYKDSLKKFTNWKRIIDASVFD